MYDPDQSPPILRLDFPKADPFAVLPKAMIEAGIAESYRLLAQGAVTEEVFVAAVYRAMQSNKPIDFAL